MHIFIDIKKDNSKGWGCLYRGNLFFFHEELVHRNFHLHQSD